MSSAKKLFFLSLGREFLKNSNRFFTIFVLALLGVVVTMSIILGSMALGESFRQSYTELQWMDAEISSPFPLGMADVEALRQLDTVAVAEGAYAEDVELLLMSGNYSLRAVSLGEQGLNLLSLAEGRFPQTASECVVSPDFTSATGLTVGDTLHLATDKSSLIESQFQIVGIGQNPNYLSPVPLPSKLSSVNSQVYLLDTAFYGGYDSIFVKFHSTTSFSTLPEEAVHVSSSQYLEEIRQVVASVSQQQCEIYVQSELAVAEEELQRADNALLVQETVSRAEIFLMEQKLSLLQEEISLAWVEYPNNPALLEEIQALELTYQDYLFTIQNKEIQVEAILEGYRKVCQDAQRYVDLLHEGAWTFTSREDNFAYMKFLDDLAYLQRLSLSLPWIFFGIYFVITIFLLSRMVEEERRQIGTFFSLGYGKWEVFAKYIAYVTVPTALAWLLGTISSYTIVPYWLLQRWSENYLLSPYALSFHWGVNIQVLLAVFVTAVLSGVLPCLPLLSASPLSLLRSKPPVIGRTVWIEKNHFLWNELNFHQKIAVRSLFRHKLRFLVQVSSIGWSCALLLTAFALEDSFLHMAELQYGQVYHYNTEVQLKEDIIPSELLEIQGLLSQYQLNNAYTLVSEVSVTIEGTEQTAELFVFPDALSVNQTVNLRLGMWFPYNMPDKGFVLSKKLEETLDLSFGDPISLQGSFGTAEGLISAVCEQYVGLRIYCTSEYLEQLTSTTLEANRLLLQYPNPDYVQSSPMLSTLLTMDGCENVIVLEEEREYYTNSNYFIEYFLQFFGAFACVLAYFVLYQLCQNSLSYRKGELATLKVLGLFDKELSAYLYRENIFYTFFGTCFGLVLGRNLYVYLVKSLESAELMLFRSVNYDVFLQATGLTVILALIVNIQAHFQIKKLDVVEEIKLTEH